MANSWFRAAAACLTVVGCLCAALSPSAAQVTTDSTRRPTQRPTAAAAQIRDSLRPPVGPGRAFLTSLVLPGLGQSRLGRQLAGSVYVGVEAMSIAMLLKSKNDLRIARGMASARIVNHYRIDPATGAPVLDANGKFVAQDTVESRFDQERVDARRTQVEDWIAVLIFNHLFAGADAFVASLLWDLPARVGLQQLPRGLGLGLSVRW